MTRYRWTIHTADQLYSGTSGDVYLSLHGLSASMKELLLPHRPDSFERNQTATGMINVVDDLGWLDSGIVRTEGGSAKRAEKWKIDYVKIQNAEDRRAWIARDVGECDPQGRCPILSFTRVKGSPSDDPLLDGIKMGLGAGSDEKQKADGKPDKPQEGESIEDTGQGDDVPGEEGEPDESGKPQADNDGGGEAEGDSESLETRLERAQAEIERLKSELAAALEAASKEKKGVRPLKDQEITTYELYGRLNQRLVPLGDVIRNGRLVAGGKVLITVSPQEGYHLGGKPGRWQAAFRNEKPEAYGLDSDKPVVASDGFNAWPVSAAYLQALFGASWRGIFE